MLLALCPLILTAAVFAPFVLPVARQETVPRFVFPLLTLLVLLSPIVLGVAGRPLALAYPVLAAVGVVRTAWPLASVGWRGAALVAVGGIVLAPYFLTEILRHPYAHDDEALCAHARRRGVTTVLVIESTTETARNRVLACAG